MKEKAIKLLLNTVYGVTGYGRFRLFRREIGEVVNAFDRELLSYTIAIAEKLGYRVIYGDSVAKSCKMLIRKNGRIELRNIEDLFERVDYRIGEKEYCVLDGIETITLDDQGRVVWKPIKYVMRHKTKKKSIQDMVDKPLVHRRQRRSQFVWICKYL